MREQLHGLISHGSGFVWHFYTVRGATNVSQLDVRGRVYLSLVLPNLFDNSHSSEIIQNWSSAEFPSHLNILMSARNIHFSDSDLDNLKVVWDRCDSQIQRLSKEDGIPLLGTFLTIRTPSTDYYCDPSPDKVYFGRIFSHYRKKHHEGRSLSESRVHPIGRIKFRGRPTLRWDSKGWTEVTTGLWRRMSVRSNSWCLPYRSIISSESMIF